MPFSEGFRGSENILTPAFDTQEELYDTIFVMLDEAIADLSAASDPIGIGGDVIYRRQCSKVEESCQCNQSKAPDAAVTG